MNFSRIFMWTDRYYFNLRCKALWGIPLYDQSVVLRKLIIPLEAICSILRQSNVSDEEYNTLGMIANVLKEECVRELRNLHFKRMATKIPDRDVRDMLLTEDHHVSKSEAARSALRDAKDLAKLTSAISSWNYPYYFSRRWKCRYFYCIPGGRSGHQLVEADHSARSETFRTNNRGASRMHAPNSAKHSNLYVGARDVSQCWTKSRISPNLHCQTRWAQMYLPKAGRILSAVRSVGDENAVISITFLEDPSIAEEISSLKSDISTSMLPSTVLREKTRYGHP